MISLGGCMRRLRPKKGLGATAYFFYVSIRALVNVNAYDEGGLFIAMVALGIAIILFFTVGGFEAEIQAPFEDSEKYRECVMGTNYDLEASLKREKENKERYYLEQKDSGKTALEGVGIVFAGILINLLSTGIDHLVPATVIPILPIGHIAGWYVEYFGIKWIFRAYLNSDMIFAKEISEKFMQHTTSVKIEECSKMIAVIQNKIREQENKAQKVSEEVKNLIGF